MQLRWGRQRSCRSDHAEDLEELAHETLLVDRIAGARDVGVDVALVERPAPPMSNDSPEF
jgi:hypothetical protein